MTTLSIILIALLILALFGWRLAWRAYRSISKRCLELREALGSLEATAHISRGDARNARMLMMAVCIQEGGEYRISRRVLAEIDPMGVLSRERDLETEDEVFRFIGQKVDVAAWFGREEKVTEKEVRVEAIPGEFINEGEVGGFRYRQNAAGIWWEWEAYTEDLVQGAWVMSGAAKSALLDCIFTYYPRPIEVDRESGKYVWSVEGVLDFMEERIGSGMIDVIRKELDRLRKETT